ncbi:MAG: thioredoxin family protein [Armatimonadota bacterium]
MMQKNSKIFVLLLLVIAIIAVVAVKSKKTTEKSQIAKVEEKSVEQKSSLKKVGVSVEEPAANLKKETTETAKTTDEKLPAAKDKTSATLAKPVPANQKNVKPIDIKPLNTTAKPAKASPSQSGKNIRPVKLIELGAPACAPCKKMLPIMDELKRDYAGKLEIVLINVQEDEKAIDKYNVNTIPAQIFLDSKGHEIFRHEGKYTKAEILNAFKSHGVNLKSSK